MICEDLRAQITGGHARFRVLIDLLRERTERKYRRERARQEEERILRKEMYMQQVSLKLTCEL
jgi:hypothetical protein